MAENEATIVIKGDTTQLVGEQKKFTNEIDKGAQKAKGLGQSFETAVGKLARGVVIAKAIGDTLKAVSAELDKITAERQKIGESGASSRVNILKDAQRLGLGGAALGTIQHAAGTTTEEQRAAFLSSLSEDDDRNLNRKALQLQATGLFTDKELKEGIANGDLSQLEASQGKRRSFLGPDFVKLEQLQEQKRSIADAQFATVRDDDLRQKESDRIREQNRLENPISAAVNEGVATGVGKVPIVGGIFESAFRGGNDLGFKILAAMQETKEAASETASNTAGKLNMTGATDNQ